MYGGARVNNNVQIMRFQILRRVGQLAATAIRGMTIEAAYGSWKSDITPDVFEKANCKSISEVQAAHGGIYYVEQSATTGRRELYFQKGANFQDRVRWAPEQSVQNSVHEYGGGVYLPLSDGSVVYSTVEGMWIQSSATGRPGQMANAVDKKFRFADFTATATHVFCVQEAHLTEHDPENRLISVSLQNGEQKVIASGADFYGTPRVSPDGQRIVWMQWNHNNMPWDETEILMAVIGDDGTVSNETVVRSGVGKSINYQYPQFKPDGTLMLINDSTNFWNVYEVDLAQSDKETNIFPVDREIGGPMWVFGDNYYATNGNKTIMNVQGRLMLRDGDSVRHIEAPDYTLFSYLSMTPEAVVYCVGQGPAKASTLLRIDTNVEPFNIEVLREARDSAEIAKYDISLPEDVIYKSDGVDILGYFYPPKNSAYTAPAGTLPPVILMGHGGPTSRSVTCLDFKRQFYTSRGFAVFDVNYRGSTGHGTAFRNMLKHNWGIVDRNDMINGAKALIERGLVDSEKVCIMGSSAGGYLVLLSLIHSNVFNAAVCVYGVADLIGLAKDTHKFEKGYNYELVGKYPEEEHIYNERSPINHVDKLSVPTFFQHGDQDTVVPLSQSLEMHEKLRARGITTALKVYENEGHGFRGARAIRESTEASYVFLCRVLGIEPSIELELQIDNLPASKL